MPRSFSALATPFLAMFQKSDELLVTNAKWYVFCAAPGAVAEPGAGGGASPPFLHATRPASSSTAIVPWLLREFRDRMRGLLKLPILFPFPPERQGTIRSILVDIGSGPTGLAAQG